MAGWLSVDEAVRYLGISRSTLYRLVKARRVPAHRLLGEGGLRFRKEDLDALMVPLEASDSQNEGGSAVMESTSFTPAGLGARGTAYPPGDSLLIGVGYSFPMANGSQIPTLDLIRDRGLYFPNDEAAKRPMPTYLVVVQDKSIQGYSRVLGMTEARIADVLPEIHPSETWAFDNVRVAYHLGEYIEWKKSINIWVRRHAVCDFDVLCKYDTWDEMKMARSRRWQEWSKLTRDDGNVIDQE